MAISKKMSEFSKRSSWIRKMFEQGAKLKAQFGAENVFDFSLGNPDLKPPKQFYRTIRSLVAEEGRHSYMPNAGYPEIRDAVAVEISSEQGVNISREETFPQSFIILRFLHLRTCSIKMSVASFENFII